MLNILKLLGKGLLYIILLPLGIAFFAVYGIYLFVVWIIMLIRSIILKAKGENPGLNDREDAEARQILEDSMTPVEPVRQGPSEINYNININGNPYQNNQMGGAQIQQNNPDVLDYSEEQSLLEEQVPEQEYEEEDN